MDRKNALKSITGLTIAALAPAVAGRTIADSQSQHKAHPKAQNIVFHLNNSEGENSLHSAFMGIGLATSLRQMGADVTLMLDASGPNFAKSSWSDKSLAAPASMAAMPPMRLGDLLADFVKAGGGIRLCPHCSAMCGVTPGTTVPGAQFAADGELARILFDADKVVDY
jgi:predicted peroxiredoxin